MGNTKSGDMRVKGATGMSGAGMWRDRIARNAAQPEVSITSRKLGTSCMK